MRYGLRLSYTNSGSFILSVMSITFDWPNAIDRIKTNRTKTTEALFTELLFSVQLPFVIMLQPVESKCRVKAGCRKIYLFPGLTGLKICTCRLHHIAPMFSR